MTTANELKPCGCGGRASPVMRLSDGDHATACNKCRMGTALYDTQEDADAAWNRALSAPPPAVAPQCPVDVANLLTDAASILDAARMDWGETWWSEFDQSVRDRITQYLQWHYTAPEKSNG